MYVVGDMEMKDISLRKAKAAFLVLRPSFISTIPAIQLHSFLFDTRPEASFTTPHSDKKCLSFET